MTPEDAFLRQAEACRGLGSPFMHRLLTLLAPRIASGGPVYDRIAGWPGDITGVGAAVALRLAGGLHRLVLGGDTALAKVYPPNRVPDRRLLTTVEDALTREAAFFDGWMHSPPQTNEVRRAAPLIAAAATLADRYELPLRLSELGASAGLNLACDRFALALPKRRIGPKRPALTLAPDWTGDHPPRGTLSVTDRRGTDLNPLDPGTEEDRLRLLSYLWPDQPQRLDNTRRAAAAATDIGLTVDRQDAAGWLADRLATRATGNIHLVYHTIAWQYFPPDTQARCTALLETAGAAATPDAPLAWFAMEADGQGPGAGLSLRVWPGAKTHALGRADFHGRWIDWRAPAP